jgi:hypothetical protein
VCIHNGFHVTTHMVIWQVQIHWPQWPIPCTAMTELLIQILHDIVLWLKWGGAGSFCCTSDILFVEEHALRGRAGHVAKSWFKYHLSDIPGRCTVQWASHHWHHTTHLWKSDALVLTFDCSMWIILIPLMCTSFTFQVLLTQYQLQIGPMFIWHFWLKNYLSN